jgi:hypothetical protein
MCDRQRRLRRKNYHLPKQAAARNPGVGRLRFLGVPVADLGGIEQPWLGPQGSRRPRRRAGRRGMCGVAGRSADGTARNHVERDRRREWHNLLGRHDRCGIARTAWPAWPRSGGWWPTPRAQRNGPGVATRARGRCERSLAAIRQVMAHVRRNTPASRRGHGAMPHSCGGNRLAAIRQVMGDAPTQAPHPGVATWARGRFGGDVAATTCSS